MGMKKNTHSSSKARACSVSVSLNTTGGGTIQGWYALLPHAYTARLLTSVRNAVGREEGWPSALFETTLEPAGRENMRP